MKTLVNYGELLKLIDGITDGIDTTEQIKRVMKQIVEAQAKEADNFSKNALGTDDTGTVDDTFKTADAPTKTVTVSKGIITKVE